MSSRRAACSVVIGHAHAPSTSSYDPRQRCQLALVSRPFVAFFPGDLWKNRRPWRGLSRLTLSLSEVVSPGPLFDVCLLPLLFQTVVAFARIPFDEGARERIGVNRTCPVAFDICASQSHALDNLRLHLKIMHCNFRKRGKLLLGRFQTVFEVLEGELALHDVTRST